MKAKSAKELLNERYGERGTEQREQFREEAFSFYFGQIIKSRRKELKLSQNELADRIGKQRPYISRIENGEDIRISNLALVANALDLSIEVTAK
ncbi:MAG: helix-turn-helix transcriptional regulator [Cyclobacteriaceae bacterium]